MDDFRRESNYQSDEVHNRGHERNEIHSGKHIEKQCQYWQDDYPDFADQGAAEKREQTQDKQTTEVHPEQGVEPGPCRRTNSAESRRIAAKIRKNVGWYQEKYIKDRKSWTISENF